MKKEFEKILNTWADSAIRLLNTEYGKIAVIMSSLNILRSQYEDLIADDKISPYEVIANIFSFQIRCLDSIEHVIKIMKPKKSELFPIFDVTSNEEIEDFNNKLFDFLYAPYDEETLNETMARIEKRLIINGLDRNFFANKKCADIGCGGGRFSFVMAKLGAEQIIGVDVGKKSLDSARFNASRLNLRQIQFILGDAYDTELLSETFDFAVSNGVAHHHTKIEDAFKEIFRILKPGGQMWLYMVGLLDEVFHPSREKIKSVMRMIPLEFTVKTLKFFDVPPNTFNQILDGMYAVYFYHSYEWIEKMLYSIGFSKVNRLKYVEGIDMPASAKIFGEGELRLVAKKKNKI